jgi:surface antigen
MFNRECVDFALWRVNQQLGSTTAPYKVLNSTFRPDGAVLGSALTWKDGWDAKGWPTGTTPRVGAVVWYSPGTGGADGTYGHVAIVKAVNGDGSFLEEGYNGNPAPDDHTYYTRTVQNGTPSAFLYLPSSNSPEEP